RCGLARVTAIARGNYQAVSERGVDIRSQRYGTHIGWKPDRLFGSLSDEALDRPYSYVVITTKCIPELQKTSEVLRPLLSAPYANKYPQPTYVLLQNGLNVEKHLHNASRSVGNGKPNVISAAVWIGTNMLSKSEVEHNDFDRATIGIYRPDNYNTTHNTPAEEALLSGFADMLAAGGSTVKVVPEVQRIKFYKNFWNVAYSSIASLTRYPLPAIYRHPGSNSPMPKPYVDPINGSLIEQHTLPVIRGVLEELLAVGRALGFPDTEDGLPSSVIDATINRTRDIHVRADSTHKPSMLLDIENGKPIEVEVIVGEVVRMARERNVPIPRIEVLYALLLVIQNQLLQGAR
ncbi:6-phosphogluconate dehydrogenase C-terminal domain-like protein, partial [Punctularia strigosozonata HHB-11173 SS5]|uniref:6-phosphogluconate dehydrogenase C-terminal domain-like protein n=1 Tax=Punctularia strigosozonata (strain HHB-11173) TaxID=741275 RepID=UPI0004418576